METPNTIIVHAGRRNTAGQVDEVTQAKGDAGVEIDFRSASGACIAVMILPRDLASKFVQDLARELTQLHLP
jgi:hypothetical protein